jgi:hypothetical protein
MKVFRCYSLVSGFLNIIAEYYTEENGKIYFYNNKNKVISIFESFYIKIYD